MKVIIKTSGGFEFTYKKILHLVYASPKHIDLVKGDPEEFLNHIRIWSDNVTGLYKEIIMEEEDNDR